MDLTLSEDQKLIANLAKEFAKKEIYPNIKEQDKKETPDPTLLKKIGKNGFLGLCIPQKYGGQGLDYITLGLTCLEFEKVDSSARFVLTIHLGLNSTCLLVWGTEEQKRKYLIPQAQGEKIGAFASCEPNAGCDIANIKTRVEFKDDHYILNGEKNWITLADVADNFIVFADTKGEKSNGLSAFIVEKKFVGVSTSTIRGKLGLRAQSVGSVHFHNVKIPKENLLGKEGEGLTVALSALDNGLYTVSAGAVGTIEACLEESTKYAKERETFGKEIGKHELIEQMIAKMVAARDIGRLLIYKVGWLKNKGLRNSRETSLAKLVNCSNAFESANNALQILGAYGYSNEFNIERYLRNSRGSLIYGLPQEIHTLIQAEYVLGYREDKPRMFDLPSWPFKETKCFAC